MFGWDRIPQLADHDPVLPDTVRILDPAHPSRHADGAGWYRCRLQRTSEGWRFAHVTLEFRYLSGEPLVHR